MAETERTGVDWDAYWESAERGRKRLTPELMNRIAAEMMCPHSLSEEERAAFVERYLRDAAVFGPEFAALSVRLSGGSETDGDPDDLP